MPCQAPPDGAGARRAAAGALLLLALAACGGRSDLPGGAAASAPEEPAPPTGCLDGLLDCDGDPANGCEVDPRTNPDHCGSCGRSCQGGACVDGACQRTILAAGIDPGCPALDEENVYVTDTASGAVLRVPKDPGEPVVLASEGGSPFWLAVQDGWVYWTTPPGLWRVPTSGGDSEVLAVSNRPLGSIAVDPQRAYVADNQAFGSILAAPIGGGDFETLVPFTALPTGLVVDGDTLYWAEGSSVLGQVMKLDFADMTPTVLAQDQQSALIVALDESHVYWNTFMGGGAISRVPRGGGPIETVAGGLAFPSGVAVAGDRVYLTTLGDLEPGVGAGTLSRAPRAGGAPETVLGGRDQPFCAVLDDKAIYWAELGTRAVYKVAR